jgi:carbamoyl-phosphate synthase small subunit
MTLPHIGNIGTTPEDDESGRVWAAGLIIRQLSPIVSSWRARQSLPDYLAERGIVGITDVNTRALVRHIRTHGAMNAAISSTTTNPAEVLALARAARDMNGLDLAREVSCAEPYHWAEAQDWWQPGREQLAVSGERFHVVAYDFGIKRNILRLLGAQGCRVTVVPATTSAAEVLALNPGRYLPLQWPWRPGGVYLRHRGGAGAIGAKTDLWHLPGAPNFGVSARCRDVQA